jgi:hypothetical protein
MQFVREFTLKTTLVACDIKDKDSNYSPCEARKCFIIQSTLGRSKLCEENIRHSVRLTLTMIFSLSFEIK